MSRYEIEVQLEATPSREAAVVREWLRAAAVAALENQEVAPPVALSILLTGNEKIRQLNHQFRQRDRVTDVLSFPADQGIPDLEHYLGDVAISLPVAQEQAGEAGHSLAAELSLLTVHGVLHLLGYDDEEPAAREIMWAAQNDILAALGIGIQPPD